MPNNPDHPAPRRRTRADDRIAELETSPTALLAQVQAITGSGAGHLWAISLDSIVASTDGGATWSSSLHRPGFYFWGIACPPAASGSNR